MELDKIYFKNMFLSLIFGMMAIGYSLGMFVTLILLDDLNKNAIITSVIFFIVGLVFLIYPIKNSSKTKKYLEGSFSPQKPL
ncbi:MAG: hypothetical protein GY861_09325 [bacterium]|nr:hypothetical protein [bacterium]